MPKGHIPVCTSRYAVMSRTKTPAGRQTLEKTPLLEISYSTLLRHTVHSVTKCRKLCD